MNGDFPDPLVTIPMASLIAKAASRPDGSVAEVLALAESVDTTVYTMRWRHYRALWRKYRSDPPPPPPPPSFQDLWAAIHRRPFRAGAGRPLSAAAEIAWLSSLHLPCGPCKPAWLAAIAATDPATFTDAKSYFAWTVEQHSRISRGNGKEQWTIDQAAIRWGVVAALTGD